jgi:hypothetical protein
MKATDYSKFKKAIFAAVEKHIANGGKLVVGSFEKGSDRCPISCLTKGEPSKKDEYYWKASARISKTPFTEGDLWCLIDGFDCNGLVPAERKKTRMYKLGQQLRAKFLPKE